MTNIQMTLLSLYSRHPNYLLKLLYRYYPLSNEIIEKFKNEINWGVISSNQTRKWDQSFIEKFADKLNWDSMSANPKYIIDKNLSSVHGWQPHEYNVWTDEFLLENAAILPWEFLCSNPNISWSEKLIDQLSPFWKKLEKESSDYTVSPWKGLSANPSVPWTWKLIEKYKKTLLNSYGLDWGELSRNTNLPWQDENLLEIYKDKWNWKLLSVNNGVGFTEEQIEKYQGLLTWDSGSSSNQNIASNTNLKWSSDFIKKYKQKWHWWSLSRNPGVNWTEEMICEFEGDIIWESMANNSNLPWSLNFILKHEEKLFKSWTITNSEFDFHIWNEVFKPIITDDLAKQILYNSSNPFQAIKSYIPEVDNTNIAQKNLEILTNLILKIDSQTNPYITNLTKIDLFLSSIQTAMTQILMVDENELKIDLKLLTELYQESDEATKHHLNALCSQVYEEIRALFVGYGIQKIAQEVVLKQNEMNENYMGFSRQGGHLSQDYSFLHSFIKNYGKRHLELARLWVKLETLKNPS